MQGEQHLPIAKLRVSDHYTTEPVAFQWRRDANCGFIGNRRIDDLKEFIAGVRQTLSTMFKGAQPQGVS